MRLTSLQRDLLKEQIVRELGEGCQMLLFGSRVDDTARGGDVDLLVRSPRSLQRKVWLEALLAARAERALDGRRVDVLLLDPATTLQSVHVNALKTGVPL
jgi:predicted nucleotidyltransferase